MPKPVTNTLSASVAAAFAAAMDRHPCPEPSAVAVSGGGDSLALMLLLRDWARKPGRSLPLVVTVDHALREGSAAEAQSVSRRAEAAGLQAFVLTRNGPLPEADVEAAAREARFRLIGDWALERGVRTVYLAHTCDDQAETLLMRLMRGSGVDGLSSMLPVATYPLPGYGGLLVSRPLLSFERSTLRGYLDAMHQDWIEDPMNEDPRFTRVRIRQAWPYLAELGFDRARLAATAGHLARARAALEADADTLAARICRPVETGLLIDGAALMSAQPEIGFRVLAGALMGVGGASYRPRFERLERLYEAIRTGALHSGRTLLGCKLAPAPRRLAQFGPQTLLVRREKKTPSSDSENIEA